jgi:ADP-ribose pyrophosphatase
MAGYNMDNTLFEKTISKKIVFQGKILKVFFDKVQLPDGKIATREKVEHPGAVAIVPVTENNEVILVKQYRYPVEEIIIEIPAGKLDDKEPSIECAKRELQEETGVINGKMILLATIYTTPGFSNEKMDIFIATGFTEIENNPDHDEFLHVIKVGIDECIRMIDNGIIMDAKSIVGILLASKHILKTKNEHFK